MTLCGPERKDIRVGITKGTYLYVFVVRFTGYEHNHNPENGDLRRNISPKVVRETMDLYENSNPSIVIIVSYIMYPMMDFISCICACAPNAGITRLYTLEVCVVGWFRRRSYRCHVRGRICG